MIEVYKATTAYGSSCHFGVESAARAWAGTNGTVERIELRDPPVLTVVPADDSPRWSKLDALREMARHRTPQLQVWVHGIVGSYAASRIRPAGGWWRTRGCRRVAP